MAGVLMCVAAGLACACGSSAVASRPHPGCDAKDRRQPCRVLFVGNSYTYVNDLPQVFARLAASGSHPVQSSALASPRATLADHVQAPETSATIRGHGWNVVVLQEQSQIPSLETLRQRAMYPPARQLVREVRNAGASPVFFLTWAHRDGWPEMGLHGYTAMQVAVDAGYGKIARELGVAVAPVGVAWSSATRRFAPTVLWQSDGTHPTPAGTYLAACVFYATLFKASPVGLSYRGSLQRRDAIVLQRLAADAAARGR